MKNSSLKISVIIVNYNVKYLLEECLFSIEKASKNINTEIFVIDNASNDGSNLFFKNRFHHVQFIWNEENIGFAKANNKVLDKITGEFILFLNPDTIIAENTLETCLDFMTKNKSCGALGVRMVDQHGVFLKESKRGFPTPMTSLWKFLSFHELFPSSPVFSKYYEGHLSEWGTNEVDVLSGAFMMLSKAALEKVKGFDEDYFMYGEDIDLSFRIKQAGFKNYYLPESTIIHHKGSSTNKKDPRYYYRFYGAMKTYVRKRYSNRFFLKSLLLVGIEIKLLLARIKCIIF